MSIFLHQISSTEQFFFKMRVPSVLLPGKADEILIIFFSLKLTWAISWEVSCPSWKRRDLGWSEARVETSVGHGWSINKVSVGHLFPGEQKQKLCSPPAPCSSWSISDRVWAAENTKAGHNGGSRQGLETSSSFSLDVVWHGFCERAGVPPNTYMASVS